MPKIVVKQPFKFAHHGYQVEEFEVSTQPRETTEECAALAIAEGWAEDADEADAAPAQPARKRATKAHGSAPEQAGNA